MATVTKPIALDESINTTEQTPRNIADVLAEELKGIADNILPPNASQIAYDNTASGLTATNVQDAIDEVISSQADVIADTMADLTENKTATVTDGVADFETIDGSLVKSLIVSIEPSQSGTGTPSPSNIRPISGYTQEDVYVVGKNMIDSSATAWKQGILVDGKKPITNNYWCYQEEYYPIKGGFIYSTQATIINAGRFNFYDKNYDFISAQQPMRGDSPRANITAPLNAKFFRIDFNLAGSATAITPNDIATYKLQLELGSTATSYEPYKGKTYTTPFNQTVYGGTLDVLTGELTVTKGIVDLGSLNWIYDSANTRFKGENMPSDYKRPSSSSERYQNLSCSCYKPDSSSVSGGMVDNTISGYEGNNNIYLYDFAYTDGSALKTARTGQKLVYPLATPTTLSLTPQTVKALVGENHIQANTGDVTECKFSMLINGDDLEMLLS